QATRRMVNTRPRPIAPIFTQLQSALGRCSGSRDSSIVSSASPLARSDSRSFFLIAPPTAWFKAVSSARSDGATWTLRRFSTHRPSSSAAAARRRTRRGESWPQPAVGSPTASIHRFEEARPANAFPEAIALALVFVVLAVAEEVEESRPFQEVVRNRPPV